MVKLQIERSRSHVNHLKSDSYTDEAVSHEVEPNTQQQERQLPVTTYTVQEVDVLRGREVVKQNLGSAGSICFVVRRPGCYFCRVQALALAVFAAMHPQIIDGFQIFGVVKETGVDDKGLAEFQQNYFSSYPVYCDKSYAFYQALGYRRLGLSEVLNPLALFGILRDVYESVTNKSEQGNVKGEGFVQGGIIIFGADGNPACMYQEETGKDLRVATIAAALGAVRRQAELRGGNVAFR